MRERDHMHEFAFDAVDDGKRKASERESHVPRINRCPDAWSLAQQIEDALCLLQELSTQAGSSRFAEFHRRLELALSRRVELDSHR